VRVDLEHGDCGEPLSLCGQALIWRVHSLTVFVARFIIWKIPCKRSAMVLPIHFPSFIRLLSSLLPGHARCQCVEVEVEVDVEIEVEVDVDVLGSDCLQRTVSIATWHSWYY
jgi:hypothetical protein